MDDFWPLRSDFALQISAHDLISLDVFDTLILRAVSVPTDVFSLVKLALITSREALVYPEILDTFPALRIKAEQLARLSKQKKHGTLEVTFEEIYDQLAELSGADPHWLAVLQKTELELEMRLAYANPAGRLIWETALAEHKKVVFCSDMYLSASFISRLLEKCGYSHYDRLYVSCEHAKTKHEGTFYDYIAGLHGIPLERILHIGDNQHSDCTMARQAGCTAMHLPLPSPPEPVIPTGGEQLF